MGRLEISIGEVKLKNPVIAGSGEATITEDGIRAALLAGAGAVVPKSTNETDAAKRQLNHTDYILLDSRWRPIKWTANPPEDAMLFSRSGLQQESFDTWLEKIVRLDAEAKGMNSYVVGKLSLANLDHCVRMAEQMQEAGLRIIEVMAGAVHGEQAVKGAISLVRDPASVQEVTQRLRKVLKVPLWIKLPHGEDMTQLAKAARDGGANAVSFIDRHLAMVPDLDTRAPILGTLGAIGGAWGLALTCRWIARTRQSVGRDLPMIGTNGARDGYDVARMLLAGASAVEMTSSVIIGGARSIARSIEELDGYLEQQGVTAAQIVGEATDKLTAYTDQPSRPGRWKDFVRPEVLGKPGR